MGRSVEKDEVGEGVGMGRGGGSSADANADADADAVLLKFAGLFPTSLRHQIPFFDLIEIVEGRMDAAAGV